MFCLKNLSSASIAVLFLQWFMKIEIEFKIKFCFESENSFLKKKISKNLKNLHIIMYYFDDLVWTAKKESVHTNQA